MTPDPNPAAKLDDDLFAGQQPAIVYCQFVGIPPNVLKCMLPKDDRLTVVPWEQNGVSGSVIQTQDEPLFRRMQARFAPRPVTDDTDDYDSLPTSAAPDLGGEG